MTVQDQPNFYYPNKMGRILLLALEEVLGREGINEILHQADLPEYIDAPLPLNQDLQFPFQHISRLQETLECTYGSRGGRGLALQAGRACFKYGLREYGAELGLTDLAFRLLPPAAKLRTGSEAFARLFNAFTDQHVHLERDEKNIYWHIDRCPLCWGRHTANSCCYLAVGLLQEALYWVSGGKFFQVEETKCIARGDSVCTIVIVQEPVG